MRDARVGDSMDSYMFSDENARGVYYYSAARAWALTGESAPAIKNLKKAIDNGWTNIQWTKEDTALESLHKHEGWKELILEMQEK